MTTAPTATYRVQFRTGMDFARAIDLVPYLQALGVSHLYASPIYAATPGSTHGYDVIDHNHFDPELGGDSGFIELSDALMAAGIGLVLDIVPNHMAAEFANPWWRSVAEWGEHSPYANHFDIDWREPLTLPILGQPFADCVAAGELSLAVSPQWGLLALKYYDALIPLHPASYPIALEGLTLPAATAIAAAAEAATPDTAEAFHAAVHAAVAPGTALTELNDALSREALIPGLLDRLHAAQPWRLGYWRDARKHLSYRRFFEVTGLVGVRVEDPLVFEDVHRTTLDHVAEGRVTGLRIDHVDGLADPTGYLRDLRAQIGDTWLVVEKILETSETLPHRWPIAGTTGYEFIDALGGALVDHRQAEAWDAAYHHAIGVSVDLEAERRAAKRQMLEVNFETELTGLTRIASELTAGRFEDATLRAAIAALLEHFPVYRTYGNAEGQSPHDLALLEAVAADALADAPELADPVAAVLALLRLDVPAANRAAAQNFTTRFQQLGGPVMAKAVEDTLFYRRNRLLALNEVGGAPDSYGRPLAAFHGAMTARVTAQPEGLLATATHDTKRGEDARARLYALSEMPDAWAANVARWRQLNAGFVATGQGSAHGAPVPSAEFEWLTYQSLAGLWPLDPVTPEGLDDLRARFMPYLTKVMREAKLFTNWVEIDPDYEALVEAYGAGLLADANRSFIDDFAATLQPLMRAGALNSLAQTLLKLTAPGIPDVYQGTEGWDLSLVDPDNRRPVDIARHAETLADLPPLSDLLASWRDGRIKQYLLQRGLAARTAHPELFTHGSYQPLAVSGAMADHVIAFARVDARSTAITVVPRWPATLLADVETDSIVPPAAVWGETSVALPEGDYVNKLMDESPLWRGEVRFAALFADCPVALLLGA